MKLRLALALVFTAVLAAAQGVKIAGDPSAAPGAAANADATKAPAPKKKAAKAKKKTAKAKKKPEESKFKTTALSENADSHYRYDENSEPIVEKKKSAAKSKKNSSSDESGEKAACADDAPCPNRKITEADSL